MGILSAIGDFLAAWAATAKLALARFTAKNAPDVKAAAVGQSDAQVADQASKAVADDDLAEIRKEASE